MTWYIHLSLSFEMVKAILGPEPNPPPGPFSQSQRLQQGAMTNSSEMLPLLAPHLHY